MATSKSNPTESGNAATNVASFATAQANRATTVLNETLSKFDTMVNAIPEKEEQIRVLEEKKAALELEIKEKRRVGLLDLDIELKSNKANTIRTILAEMGQVAVDNSVLEAHELLKNDFKKEVAAATAVATNAAKREHQYEMSQLTSTHQREQASNVAEINSQKLVIVNLEKQVDSLNNQIRLEREARVQEAQARGNAVVNVQAGK